MVKTVSAEQQEPKPSLKRWFRNACYIPWHTKRCFNKEALDEIEQAVARAEGGHNGEIVVIIEGNLPLSLAYRHTTLQRALQLFAETQVWDTEYDSGVLLYVNLCQRQVELLADRGIHAFVDASYWQEICDLVTAQLKTKHYKSGVLLGVDQIGKTLQAFYTAKALDHGNERSNRPILI